jgi:hypothetical protein
MKSPQDDKPMVDDEAKDQPKPEGPKVHPRPKMTLEEQAVFISELLRRCRMHTGVNKDHFAGVATLTLTLQDMLRLETIQQTLAIFETHKAGDLVKREIGRKIRERRS